MPTLQSLLYASGQDAINQIISFTSGLSDFRLPDLSNLMFNIRVYGILTNEQRQVLVTDELIRGMQITKFPGGGLEFGEGTRDCLKREFMEEMNLAVEIDAHLYTTDFFQMSAFNPEHQIISIYYFVKALEPITVRLSNIEFDFDEAQLQIYVEKKEIETFRFIDWENFSAESVHLPIDKVVAKMVKENSLYA